MRSQGYRMLAPVFILSILLTANGAAADGTGAPSREINARVSKWSDAAQDAAHLQRLKALAQRREAAKAAPRGATVGLLRWDEKPAPLPIAYSLRTRTIPQMPVADDARYCVHCGVAATLIALRFFESTGRLSINDLSAFSDSKALKLLGDGFLAGKRNSDYAIMRQAPDGDWYGDQYQMKANLNLRQGYDPYMISSSSAYPTDTALSQALRYPIWAGKPVILLVDTSFLAYYRGMQLGHFVVMDGWASAGAIHQINDPNNCSKRAKEYSLFGWHEVPQRETRNALAAYRTANILW